MRLSGSWLAAAVAVLAVPAIAASSDRQMPYFGSIQAKEVRMRTGPGRSYPVSWKYVRPDLPVKVVKSFKEKGAGALWKEVEDPSGTQGWMQANLVSDTRTAIVMGDITDLRDSPGYSAKINWRAAPGVVGKISKCKVGWCYLDVKGRGGFIEISHLWGIAPDETID